MKRFQYTFIWILGFISLIPLTQAQESPQFPNDLFINAVEVKDYVLIGDQVRFYVEVGNASEIDLKGVVKIYDETLGAFIGPEQPVSVLSNQTDAVFFDYVLEKKASARDFNIRVLPNDPSGDNPNNNTRKVSVYVDIDSDKDGRPNKTDEDDDNDGVKDDQDLFRLDPNESADSDGDKIGDNADTDDDNDGVEDLLDAFPLDAKESKDTDKDGVGDNADVFPNDPKESQDTDGDGLGNNADTNDDNKGPIVSMSTPESVVPTHTGVAFSAKGSSDPDGKVASYEWNFGDGTSAKGLNVEHSFKKSGEYSVTLKVTDDAGESRTEKLTLTVVHKWQVYALGALALLLFLLMLLYWALSRKKNKSAPAFDEVEKKVQNLTLGKSKNANPSKGNKGKSTPKKSGPKKS